MDPGRARRDGRRARGWAPTCCARRARSVDIDRHRRLPDGARPLHPGPVVSDGHRLQPPGRAARRRRRLAHAAVQADARHRSDAGGPARWFARGATDDKGPALAALYGARLAIENGVRANIQFLWELEEEIGSPHFAAGLAAAVAGDAAAGRAPFTTDSVVVSDTIWIAAGQPSISVRPARADGVHGRARDRRQGRALGDHRRRRAQPDRRARGAARAMLRRAHRQGEDPGLLRRRAQAVRRRAQGVRARRLLAQAVRRRARARQSLRPIRDDVGGLVALTAAPTFEVHGLVGGYAGPGIKTIVPHRAELKLSTRLVPDQKPAKMFKLIKRFIKKRLPGRGGDARSVARAVPRADGRPHQRRRGRGGAGDVRQAAGLRARRRLDWRGADHAQDAEGAGHVPGAVAPRARLPRHQRELRLGPGLRRHGDVLPLFHEIAALAGPPGAARQVESAARGATLRP